MSFNYRENKIKGYKHSFEFNNIYYNINFFDKKNYTDFIKYSCGFFNAVSAKSASIVRIFIYSYLQKDNQNLFDQENRRIFIENASFIKPISFRQGSVNYELWFSVEARMAHIVYQESIDSSLTIFRIVRDILKIYILNSGYIPFHASCIKYLNQGICIIGEKNQGKTTTALNFSLNTKPKAEFISNDKLFIKSSENMISAISLPTALGVRKGTVDLLKELEKLDLKDIYNKTKEKFYISIDMLFKLGIKVNYQTGVFLFIHPIKDFNIEQGYIEVVEKFEEKREIIENSVLKICFPYREFFTSYITTNDDYINQVMKITKGAIILKLHQNAHSLKDSIELIRKFVLNNAKK